MRSHLPMVGLCRFSYLGSGGFKVEHDSLQSRADYLYEPARLEARFRLFEAITLPCIAHQTDPDFKLLLVVGASFPRTYLERLSDLIAPIPQIEIIAAEPDNHRKVMSRILRQARPPNDRPYLQFRLDDDDAMALDFVERFRQTALDVKGLWQDHPAIAVDFNKGFVFTAGPNGLQLWPFKYPYSAISLGMITQPGCDDTIFGAGHHNIWKRMPTIILPDSDMMMRSHHAHNDSRQSGKGNTFDYQPLSAEDEKHILDRFGISNEQVKQVFSRAAPAALDRR